MHHMYSQLFTETNVAEGRMNLRIASWRFGTMSLAQANMVSLLPLIISGLCLDFTLQHLHTTWYLMYIDEKEMMQWCWDGNPEELNFSYSTHIILFPSRCNDSVILTCISVILILRGCSDSELDCRLNVTIMSVKFCQQTSLTIAVDRQGSWLGTRRGLWGRCDNQQQMCCRPSLLLRVSYQLTGSARLRNLGNFVRLALIRRVASRVGILCAFNIGSAWGHKR